MTEIGYYLYENVPLREKFGWIQNAAGARAVDTSRVGLGNLGNEFISSDQSIRAMLAPLGVAWTGQAADNAAQALRRAADRGGVVGAAGGAGSGSVGGYGQSFEEMRTKVHWEDPGSWDWWEIPTDLVGIGLDGAIGDVFDIQSDYFSTIEQNRTLDAEATAALYGHENLSRATLAGFPAVEPAAALTADAPGVAAGPVSFGGVWGGGPADGRFGALTPDHGSSGSVLASTSPAGSFGPPAGSASPGLAVVPDAGGSRSPLPAIGPALVAGAPGGMSTAQPPTGRNAGAGATAGIPAGGPGGPTGHPAGTSSLGVRPAPSGAKWGGPAQGGGPGRRDSIPRADRAGWAPATAVNRGPPGSPPGNYGYRGQENGAAATAGDRGQTGGAPGAAGYRAPGGGPSTVGHRGQANGPLGADRGRASVAPGDEAYRGRTDRVLRPPGDGSHTGVPPGGRWGGWGTGAPAVEDRAARAAAWGGPSTSGGPAGTNAYGGRAGGMSGTEFGSRFPPGGSESGGAARSSSPPATTSSHAGTGRAAVAGGYGPMPFLGGMGAGAGSSPTERKTKYWIPSSEAFDVPLPPHTDGVIEGRDE